MQKMQKLQKGAVSENILTSYSGNAERFTDGFVWLDKSLNHFSIRHSLRLRNY
jgi:hypothetical protein